MHDLGGKQGFGTVAYEPGGPVYHDDWHALIHAISSFAVRSKIYNMDEYRHAIERMEPRHYLSASYYERVLTGAATLYVEKSVIDLARLEALAGGRFPLARAAGAGRLPRPDAETLEIGAKVKVRNEFVSGHHRMPGYIRGKTGVVVGIAPVSPFPDASGHGLRAPQEGTYDVQFNTKELWPDGADDAFIHVAVFQSYLERS